MAKKITKRQQAFLDAYRELGFVHGAALKAGVSRELHYNAMRVSKPYREAFREIEQTFALKLEEEARRLAVIGEVVPVYYGRKIVGFRNRPSDRLLIFLLKANNPEKFVEPLRRRRTRKPDSRAISRGNAVAPSFSWKRMSRALRNQSVSGGSIRKPAPSPSVPPPCNPEVLPAPKVVDTPAGQPGGETRKPDNEPLFWLHPRVDSEGRFYGSALKNPPEWEARHESTAPAPEETRAPSPLPNTADWRRSPVSATRRPTPPRSSGTLVTNTDHWRRGLLARPIAPRRPGPAERWQSDGTLGGEVVRLRDETGPG